MSGTAPPRGLLAGPTIGHPEGKPNLENAFRTATMDLRGLLVGVPDGGRMPTCEVSGALDERDPLVEELWRLYERGSEDRRPTRLLRDILTRSEFASFLTTAPGR